MPCDTIQTSTVKFKPENRDFFKKALASLGYAVTENGETILGVSSDGSVSLASGELTVRSRTGVDVNAFKRAYSKEVVFSAANKFGWTLAPQTELKFSVQKRGF